MPGRDPERHSEERHSEERRWPHSQVNSIQFSPMETDLMVSGSNDWTARLFDIRNLSSTSSSGRDLWCPFFTGRIFILLPLALAHCRLFGRALHPNKIAAGMAAMLEVCSQEHCWAASKRESEFWYTIQQYLMQYSKV